MKYSTRTHHLPDAPCEFAIFDKDPSAEVAFQVPIVSAIGRMCTEPDTRFGNSIHSQASEEPRNAIGSLRRFQRQHSLVDMTYSESKLRKHAPELGALLGIAVEPAEPAPIDVELGAVDINAAVVDAFESGAHAREFES